MASLPCQLMLWTCLHLNHSQRQPVQLMKENNRRSTTWGNVWKRYMNHFPWYGQKAKMSLASQMMAMLPFLPMNTTFILCPTLIVMGTSMQKILFLAESPAFTPLPSLGKLYTVTCISDAVLCNTMHTLLMQHYVGHINLIHCPTYGELPFIQLDSAQMISKGKECSINTGTPQFWKTMLVLSGYFDWLLCKQRGEGWPPLECFTIPWLLWIFDW